MDRTDTNFSDSIIFTPASASDYLQHLLKMKNLWRGEDNRMKYSLKRLIDLANEPFDSIAKGLLSFQYDSVDFKEVSIVEADTVLLNWLNDSTFIFTTTLLEREPFISKKIVVGQEAKPDMHISESLLNSEELEDTVVHSPDTILQSPDTIINVYIDTLYLDSMNVQLFSVVKNEIVPAIKIPSNMSYLTFFPDSTGLIYSDTTWHKVANINSPFYSLPNGMFTDSLKYAVNELLRYTTKRDSIQLFINDINGQKTPIWIGTGDENLDRFWVKNYRNDSITVWVGNPAPNNISLYLEDEVIIKRMMKRQYNATPFTLAMPKTSLAPLEPLKKKPIFWEYDLSTSFAFSQTLLSQYWAKGGESSITSLIDIKGNMKYNDTKMKQKWISSARMKYGSILSGEYGLRVNTDLIEINSQYNKVIKGKFDFSTVFYMKSQIAKGYKYPNDSTVISKFLNPGSFTIGTGVEYKPFKSTVINVSPLSYKNTFVLDTAINETNHGIEEGMRSKQEFGGQLVLTNKLKILNGLEIDNTLRMFSSYSAKPMNVDFDWEINLKKQLTWFFSIAANLQLIYDKDILFSIKEDGELVKNPDGSQKKAPKLQFREFVGLSVAFNF